MAVPFELQIALRYLLARRKQAFISIISLISTLGVIVGVMALVLALALMTGLQQELRDRILGSTAHVFVWKLDGYADYHAEAARLKALPHVTGAAPAVIGQGLVTTPKESAFLTIKGIDPALEAGVTNIAQAMSSGRLSAIAPPPTDDPAAGDAAGDDVPGILLGKDLAQKLGVAVGDAVTLTTAQGTLSPMGMMPRQRRLAVRGIFSLGLYEFDSAYGFVSLPVAERLLNLDRIQLIELKTDDIYRAPEIADSIRQTLGEKYFTEDWSDMNRSLFSALWLEKMVVSITIGLIVLVAALNIVASLILLVMEKHGDIAILKTMGASARSIMAVFMLQGLAIGLVGTTIGTIGGYGLASVLDRYRLIRIPYDVYQVSYVPFTIQPLDLTVVIVSAVLICFVATIYPARQAAKLDPAEALRYG